MGAKPFSVHEAKTHLSRLIERAEAGEEVIIARGKIPVVRLVPVVAAKVERSFGAMKGKAKVTPAFFDALPEDELALWE
jgi:prevent-host-death family protein